MKKIVFCITTLLLLVSYSYAGERITLPYNVVVSDPTTNQAEKMYIKIIFKENGNSYAVLEYNVLNNTGTKVLYTYSFAVRNKPDDPESITENCLDVGNPWPLCTGAGTCENDCDESTTDFSDYLEGFAALLNSRTNSLMNGDLQNRHEIQ